MPPGTPGLDRWALEVVLRHRTPSLTTVFRSVTVLGSSLVLLPLLVVFAIACWHRPGGQRAVALVGTAYAAAVVASQVLKVLVARQRPPTDVAVVHYGNYAFPSGHATQAAAFWLAMAIATWPWLAWRWIRAAILVAALVVVLAVGVSRVYLGAHWLTDVLAGWMLGTVCWAGTSFLFRRAQPRPAASYDRAT